MGNLSKQLLREALWTPGTSHRFVLPAQVGVSHVDFTFPSFLKAALGDGPQRTVDYHPFLGTAPAEAGKCWKLFDILLTASV